MIKSITYKMSDATDDDTANDGFIPPEEYVDVIKKPRLSPQIFLFLITKAKSFSVSVIMNRPKTLGLYQVDAGQKT